MTGATLTRIESTPDLVDRVYRALLDAISEGTLSPGARMTQEEIAEQLAVSRQPVLQALRQLKNDGFLHDAPGRGLIVAPLDANWLSQVYQVRNALDALAARLAATAVLEHKARGYAYTHDTLLIARGRAAAKKNNVAQLIDCDIEFHAAIYAAANNPLIEQTAAMHWRHIRRAMGAVLQSAVTRDAVWDEHEAIGKAIARGNAPAAEQLMGRHGDAAREHLLRQLASMQSEGDASTRRAIKK
ncbi:MAG: GntR family transcriptional regulator [Casimicrobium sp.]